jgi:hypothetical protein
MDKVALNGERRWRRSGCVLGSWVLGLLERWLLVATVAKGKKNVEEEDVKVALDQKC